MLERGGQTWFYHSDVMGSVFALTDSSGKVAVSYSYEVGIPLTQVAPICSMRADGGVPTESDGIRGELRQRGGMSGVSGEAPVAGGFRLSALRIGEGLAGAGSVAVCWMRVPNFGDCRNDFPGHAHSVDGVVSRHVVGDDPEERRQRVGAATSAGPEEVRDSLDMAAQIAPCHGQAGARPAHRQSRGGRMLCGRSGGRTARPAQLG